MLIPDHETAVDFLNYEAIAKTVVQLLKDNRQRALTIGIHGDWGAGKSSVLKMVESAMADDKKVTCLWFNGWAFQGFDDAKTVLIEVIIAELVRQRSTFEKVKGIGERLLKRVDAMKLARRGLSIAFTLATGLPSPDLLNTALTTLQGLAQSVKSLPPTEIEGKINEAASFLKPAEAHRIQEEIYHFREEFEELLKEANIHQLVVLIDDLDRCLPVTAIDTLEAIRLFLFVPKTAFVIGADEGMIEYAVRQHFPNLSLASGGVPYTRNYLEKLIQVPFRIPALGIQESRAYVTLLLVQDIVGEDHTGFKTLLDQARKSLNQPWLGANISQADVRSVAPDQQDAIDTAYVLAQQIGPILAEGTKGNPRQIKRFLNSMWIRLAIAKERGFEEEKMSPAILGKLMLAERFQQDFYEYVTTKAMLAQDGKIAELNGMEDAVVDDKKTKSSKKVGKGESTAEWSDEDTSKWLEREWLKRWLKIEPALGAVDLRPYVFVARDRRILATTVESSGLESLIETLMSESSLAVRGAEQQVKELQPADAGHVFASLQESVLRPGTFTTEPLGFEGMKIVAKHHPRHQSELLSILSSTDEKTLGFWVVKGWSGNITEPSAVKELQTLLARWAAQNDNTALKQAAVQALKTSRKSSH